MKRGRKATDLIEAAGLPKGEADAPDVGFAGDGDASGRTTGDSRLGGGSRFHRYFTYFDTNRWP